MISDDTPKRLAEARAATNERPSDPAVWIALSQLCHIIIDQEGMTAAARRAYELQPDNVDAIRQLAFSLAQTGTGIVAYEDQAMFERLFSLAPEDEVALHYLYHYALLDGNYGRAIELSKTLDRLHTNDPCVAARMGRAQRLLGDWRAAQRSFALAAARCESDKQPFPFGPYAACKPAFARLAGDVAAGERHSKELCQEEGDGLADLSNSRYPKDCAVAMARLQERVAGRDLFIFGHGPSLAEIAARQFEIASLDFASMSMSTFQIIDDDILRPIGKRVNMACLTHPTVVTNQLSAIQAWFASFPSATLILPLWLREYAEVCGGMDFLAHHPDHLFWFDCIDERPPFPAEPLHFPNVNTLICALGPAVLARPRRIFLFGFDGQIRGNDCLQPGALYYREDHPDYHDDRNEDAVRRSIKSWLWWDTLQFNELALTVIRHVGLLFEVPLPPIYNVCFNSALTAFPRVTFERFLKIVRS